MSAHCQVTGRVPGFGNTEGRRVTLRVSAKGIKVIDRDAIEAVVARSRRNGEKI